MTGGIPEVSFASAAVRRMAKSQVRIARARDAVNALIEAGLRDPVSMRVSGTDLFVMGTSRLVAHPLASATMLFDLAGEVVPFAPGWTQDPPDESSHHARLYRSLAGARADVIVGGRDGATILVFSEGGGCSLG